MISLPTFAIAATGLAVIVAGVACGDDDSSDDDKEAVEAAVQEFQRADQSVDIDAYMAITTPHFIESLYGAMGVPAEALKESPGDFLGSQPPLTVEKVSVDGDKATATVSSVAATSSSETWVSAHLVKQDGKWKLDEVEPTKALDTPDKAKVVDVGLEDFSFEFDESKVQSGFPVVLRGKNDSEQPHMLYLARIPADANLEELLKSEDTPPGVTDVADSFIWAPGTEGDVVVTSNLEAGRYVMLCFLPDVDDPEGTPHFAKGMVADFEVK